MMSFSRTLVLFSFVFIAWIDALSSKPVHYDLSLEPLFHNSTFRGHVKIDLDVLENTYEIILNAKDLNIIDATLATDAGK